MKSKSKIKSALYVVVVILFGICVFSIPACSFSPKLNLLTWLFTVALVVLAVVTLALFHKFELDAINGSLVLFIISSLVSSTLNRFKGFVFTPIYLAGITIVIYTYLKQTRNWKWFLISAFFGLLCFSVLFIVKYKDDFISLNFFRLGNEFGDENDIAVCLALGYSLGLINILFIKKIWLSITSGISLLLFILCGLSTGSKTFVLIVIVVTLSSVFLFFGKKKWYFSLVVCCALIALGITLLLMPPFATIKQRLLEMLSTLFGKNIAGARDDDFSTIGRLQMFMDGINLFLRKPLFGFGINGFFAHSSFGYAWSHNHFSETLVSFGVVGTMFFHYGLFSLVYQKCKYKNECLTIPLLIAIFYFSCMFSVALNSQKIYAYIVGIAFSNLENQEKNIVKPIEFIKLKRKIAYENC